MLYDGQGEHVLSVMSCWCSLLGISGVWVETGKAMSHRDVCWIGSVVSVP